MNTLHIYNVILLKGPTLLWGPYVIWVACLWFTGYNLLDQAIISHFYGSKIQHNFSYYDYPRDNY